jgi:hypothetical protein
MRRRRDPGKSWLAFLQNHREVIVAFDFFTVPTLTFQLLYCFFVIEQVPSVPRLFHVRAVPNSWRFNPVPNVPVFLVAEDMPIRDHCVHMGRGRKSRTLGTQRNR